MTDQTVTIRHGNSLLLLIPVTDTAGDPLNLSGASAKWWVGKGPGSVGADVVLKKDTVGGSITITSVGSLFTLNVPLEPVDTEAVPPSVSYYHEAEVTDSSGNVYSVVSGTFQLLPSLIT